MSNKRGEADNQILEKCRIITESEENQSQLVWMSWKEGCGKEGEEVLLENVRAGTIQSMRNPDIPSNSKLKWPHFPQVRLKREINTVQQRRTGRRMAEDNVVKFQGYAPCRHR